MSDSKSVEIDPKSDVGAIVRDGVAHYTARTQYQKWSRG